MNGLIKDLSSSRASESSALSSLDSLISTYRCTSFENDDFILDCDITTEEISGVIKLLKKGKACGPDNILPEHIIYGGDYLVIWLKKVFNEIIQLERIPSSLKDTIIVPIYKGEGTHSWQRTTGVSRSHLFWSNCLSVYYC